MAVAEIFPHTDRDIERSETPWFAITIKWLIVQVVCRARLAEPTDLDESQVITPGQRRAMLVHSHERRQDSNLGFRGGSHSLSGFTLASTRCGASIPSQHGVLGR